MVKMEEQQQPNQKKEKSKDEEGLTAYSRYSTIAIQMVVIIVITSLGGVKLDKLAGTKPLLDSYPVPAGSGSCHVARHQGSHQKQIE
ncbi:MAG: AtpZ/AtpI family protein [Marinilabiliales bacterium]|nr:AtpZ/AtpI family protein [Marinilabiliales bacterium]